MDKIDQSRRKFVKKIAYVTPVIATLTVLPAFHASGSGWEPDRQQHGNNGIGNDPDHQPPGNPHVNDDAGNGEGKSHDRQQHGNNGIGYGLDHQPPR